MGISTEWRQKLLGEENRAGRMVRCVALFYDMICVTFVLLFTTMATTLWMVSQTNAPKTANFAIIRNYIIEHEPHLFWISDALMIGMFLAYFYLFPLFGPKKQTVGMMITGLEIQNEQAQIVSGKVFLLREINKLISFYTLWLPYKEVKRPWYERKTGTYMITY